MRIAIVATALVLAFLSSAANGDVVRVQPPDELFERCTVVFGGRLESVRERSSEEKSVPRRSVYEYSFTVGQVWKGPLEKQFVVYSRDRLSRVRDGSYCMVYCYMGNLAFGSADQLETAASLCRPMREATYDQVVLRESFVVDATLAVGRPTVEELEQLSAGTNSFVAGAARKARGYIEGLDGEVEAAKGR